MKSKTFDTDKAIYKLLKFLLNFLLWFFIVPLIIDLYLYITSNKLLTDGLFGAKRTTQNHITYFVVYAIYVITWVAFAITLIINMIYIVLNNESIVEKITQTKTTFKR